jgi:hypothetical protein
MLATTIRSPAHVPSTLNARANPIPSAVPGEVREDGPEPRLQIRPWREAIRGPKRVQVRVLHQVVGFGPTLGEPKGKHPQGAEVVERLVVERRRPVLAESAHVACTKHLEAPYYSTNGREVTRIE